MKRVIAVALCAIALCLMVGCTSCKGTDENTSLFTFLSVRMKGNGDGTITAVAQNEFSLVPAVLPVTLTLYISDEVEAETSEMTKLTSVESSDLNIFQSLTILWMVENQGYYLAEVAFSMNGQTRYIKSQLVFYDIDGDRTA